MKLAEVEIVEGADHSAIARWISGAIEAALDAAEGPIAISLPGGSTPFPILERLVAERLDWSAITIWPGDDRIVPEDHAASNVGKIRKLLEPAGARVINLESAFSGTLVPPHFALVWLGMGADGHIASLFPNSDPQVDDRQKLRRLTPDPLPVEAPFDRLTLTIPALLDSDALMFVMSGEEKRALFAGAMAGEHDLPISRLLGAARAGGKPVTCFI